MTKIDLTADGLRAVNVKLQNPQKIDMKFDILNPNGAHSLACGITHPIKVRIAGHVGYYCAGMNQQAHIDVMGNAGVGVAENLVSGTVQIAGDASQSAGASGVGGLLIIKGNASARCGISMRGIDIVVRGSVGHNAAFMAQAGNLVVCGDAEDGLGDSIYEAVIYVRGSVKALGADCVEKPMTQDHVESLSSLLEKANEDADPDSFRRYGSARQLYHFKTENMASY